MPPAGSLKVLHAPAHRGGIRRAPQTKIYNLETREYCSIPPFSKINLAGVIKWLTFRRERWIKKKSKTAGTMNFKKIENLEFLK
jgi:hypothetical protein